MHEDLVRVGKIEARQTTTVMRIRTTLSLLAGLTFVACATTTLPDAGAPGGDATTHDPSDAAPTHEDASSPDASSSDANVPIRPGPPGCGLAAAAFCETFDAPMATGGRAGELDGTRWSGSRMSPLPQAGAGNVFPIGAATLPTCRPELPVSVFPDRDMLVCDPSEAIESRHLMMAVAAQNYGLGSLRIRQPFDFASRTGTIVFDAQGYATLGWISVELTDEPIPVPSYARFVNDEGGIPPHDAIELQFSTTCGEGGVPTHVGLDAVHVFRDHVDTILPSNGHCVSVAKGQLNHFEVAVSEHHVEVRVSPVSTDGVTFAPAEVVFSADVELGFSRGWVHVTTHNHASLKYSTGSWAGNQGETALDAWISRWDNIGFDGPIIDTYREAEAPDSLAPTPVPYDVPADPERHGMSIGYVVPDRMDGTLALPLQRVDLAALDAATLTLAIFYPTPVTESSTLWYRANGHTWHARSLTAQEVDMLTHGPMLITSAGETRGSGLLGELAHTLDVPVAELVAGENVIELATSDVPRGYPPSVANVDLVLHHR